MKHKLIMENWRRFLAEESDKDPEKPHDDGDEHDERCDYIDCDGDDESVDEAKNKDGKEKGVDGKACWKGKKYAGSVDTDGDGKADKDKCVPMEEKKKN